MFIISKIQNFSFNISEIEYSSDDNDLPSDFNLQDMGLVYSVGDGVVYAYGLLTIEAGALVEIFTTEVGESLENSGQKSVMGMILNLEFAKVAIVLFGNDRFVCPGDLVVKKANAVFIGVGPQMLGHVVDSLGNNVSTTSDLLYENFYEADSKAPGIIERKSVHEPLQTGIKAIDSMIPIGRGQRELIIGDRKTGKTTVAINTILMQSIDNLGLEQDRVYSIYVSIGQKRNSIIALEKLLNMYLAMDDSIIVTANSSDPAALQYLAPYTACSMGEWFRDGGMHALIIYDDLSKHANAYRQLSLLLRRPPGREAYPGDVFYLHSRLLERAAKLSNDYGSGSLTALPIIETQKGDVSAYIPTNVISITDGQIFLETDLFYNGIRPAVNVGLSVSRVGSAAQNVVLKKASSSLRFDLAQYRTVAVLEELSSDLDPTTKQQIHRGVRLVEILKQAPYRPVMVEQQAVLMYAATNGFFDDIEVQNVLNFEQKVLNMYNDEDYAFALLASTDESYLEYSLLTEINLRNIKQHA
jgi:F-type H+-transporting ATPase subunit alpha